MIGKEKFRAKKEEATLMVKSRGVDSKEENITMPRLNGFGGIMPCVLGRYHEGSWMKCLTWRFTM